MCRQPRPRGGDIFAFYKTYEKRDYYCPEYVEGQSGRFQELPREILLQVLECLDPSLDIRALRYVRRIFRETKLNFVKRVVDEILEKQRKQFLEMKFPARNRGVMSGDSSVDGSVDETLRQFVGRQLICEAEDIEGDPWVFKESQLPYAIHYSFTNRPLTAQTGTIAERLGKRLSVNVGHMRIIAEDEYAGHLSKIRDIETHEEENQAKTRPALIGYGAVCKRISWW